MLIANLKLSGGAKSIQNAAHGNGCQLHGTKEKSFSTCLKERDNSDLKQLVRQTEQAIGAFLLAYVVED